MRRSERAHDERGLVMGSRVVLLSVVAVAMAGVAFFVTAEEQPEREIAIPVRATPTSTAEPTPSPKAAPAKKKAKPKPPPIKRDETYVVVFNNSGISGLAGSVATQAGEVGWQVVGSDNWYGTIPANTVYYPERLEREAKQLALDLGIERIMPSIEPMQFDRLTVILTGPPG